MKNRISLLFLTLALFCAFFQTAQSQDATAKNKATIMAAYDALNRKDWAAFSALCAPNYTEVNVGPAPAVGINAALDLYKQFHTAFPDFKVKINEIAPVSSTRFLLRVTITGTNTGPFMMLPPTGKSIKFDDSDVVELNAEGKAISHSITNMGEPLRQIGYGSLNNPNTGVVMAAYGAFGKGDIPGVLALCSDNVTWDVSDIPAPGMEKKVYTGKAAVEQFFTQLGSKVHFNKFEPWRFIADGDDVIVLINAEFKSLVDNKTYSFAANHHLTVKNGKVTSFKETATPVKPM
jgi:ketosteroid isomerase-like protein